MRMSFLCVVCVALVATSSLAQEKGYRAERYDIRISINHDRSIDVVETVTFRFDGGPFTYVRRAIPQGRSDGIDGFVASMEDRELPAGSGPGQVEIRRGRNRRLTWHFEPVWNATRTFGLRYHAAGVVERTDAADVLVWQALPREHPYVIDVATVHATWPAGTDLAGRPDVQPPASVIAAGSEVTIEARNIGRNGPLRVTLPLEPGALAAALPVWQQRALRERELAPWFIGASLLIACTGILWVVSFRASHAPVVAPSDASMRLDAPPETQPVALAAALAASGARPSITHGLAALFDLARRGAVRIEEEPRGSRWRPRRFVITRVSPPLSLRSHEQALVDVLFTRKGVVREQESLSKAVARLRGKWTVVRRVITEELRAAGFLDPERERVRDMLVASAVALTVAAVLGIVGAIVAIPRFGGWILMVPVAIGAVAAAAGIAASSFSPLSASGAWHAARWRAFLARAREVARGRDRAELANLDQWFAYAAALGLATSYAKAARKAGVTTLPPWFRVLSEEGDSGGALVAMSGAVSSSAGAGGGAASGGAGGGSSSAG